MVLPHQISIPLRKKKRWNILIYYYEDASVTSPALILLLTCDWWMTEFNKVQSTLADWMKFGMQKYVEVCVLYGTVCVCDWGRCGGGFVFYIFRSPLVLSSLTLCSSSSCLSSPHSRVNQPPPALNSRGRRWDKQTHTFFSEQWN